MDPVRATGKFLQSNQKYPQAREESLLGLWDVLRTREAFSLNTMGPRTRENNLTPVPPKDNSEELQPSDMDFAVWDRKIISRGQTMLLLMQ